MAVLFLCKGNSARSIMGEAILNRMGRDKIKAFSAGSDPAGSIHPHTLFVLGEAGYGIDGLRSKSWDIFGASDTPQLDLVITLCDDQSLEVCPIWPGRPARAHWSLPDPVKDSLDHDDARAPFRAARARLEERIQGLVDRLTQIRRLDRDAIETAAHAA